VVTQVEHAISEKPRPAALTAVPAAVSANSALLGVGVLGCEAFDPLAAELGMTQRSTN
jgi:hypothetical protein